MITIIKMGEVPQTEPKIKYQTTCKVCNTVFEHHDTDCRFILHYTGDYIQRVKCPLCKSNITPGPRHNTEI